MEEGRTRSTRRDTQPPPEHPLLERARAYSQQRSGDLVHDVCVFALLLRGVGVRVSVASVLLACESLTVVRLDQMADVHAALRCCLAAAAEEAAVFDIVFPAFWAEAGPDLAVAGQDAGGGSTEAGGGEGLEAMLGDLAGEGGRRVERSTQRALYSRTGRAETTPTVAANYQRQTDDVARRLARALGGTRGRRRQIGDRGDLVDIRDSLRHNLRFGEEMLLLRRSQEVPDRTRVAVLCDVSSSMTPYTPLFLAFAHSLTRHVHWVESAIFNIELSSVTDVFKQKSLSQALRWLEAQSISLAGGTRIGHCLHRFNTRLEARGSLRPTTTAIILSDGWDVGDVELLEREMDRLRSHVGRLIWLDPHAAATGYRPQVRGLQVALPFVDDHVDFSSPESLSDLVGRIEGVGTSGRMHVPAA